MQVLIATEGSNQLGIGHVIRCMSLYQAFEDEGIQAEIIMYGDDAAISIVRKATHIISHWIDDTKSLYEKARHADIVIIDSTLAPFKIYKSISSLTKVTVYFDDNKRIDYPKGIVINRTIHAELFDYKKKSDNVYLFGLKYLPLTKAFWYVPNKRISKQIQNMMISFGGSDPREMTPKVLKYINKKYPRMHKMIVIGKAFENVSQIKKLADSNSKLYYFPTGESIKNIMLKADIAISAGGQTLYELARIGVPTVGVAVVDNQLNNIKGLEKVKFLEFAGWWNDKNIMSSLTEKIDVLSDYKVRKEKSIIGRSLVDGYGSVRIANFLLGAASI